MGAFDGNFPKGQMSTIHGGGAYQSSIGGRDDSSIYNMRNIESSLGYGGGTKSRDVLNFPYMCDENPNAQEELQFADKIKMMNNQKASSVATTQRPQVVTSVSGDPLTTILIQTFVDMMQVEGDLDRKRRELAMRQDFNITDCYKLFNCVK